MPTAAFNLAALEEKYDATVLLGDSMTVEQFRESYDPETGLVVAVVGLPLKAFVSCDHDEIVKLLQEMMTPPALADCPVQHFVALGALPPLTGELVNFDNPGGYVLLRVFCDGTKVFHELLNERPLNLNDPDAFDTFMGNNRARARAADMFPTDEPEPETEE